MFKFFILFVFHYFYLFFNPMFLSGANKYLYQNNVSAQDSVLKYRDLSKKSYKEGNLDDFGKYSYKVLAIAEKHDLREIKIRTLINLAIYHQRKDEYKKALTKYLKAEESSTYLNDSSYLKVVLNTNLGNFYYLINDLEKAKSTMNKMLKLATYQEGDKKKKISIPALNMLGNINADQKNYTEAFKHFNTLKKLLENDNSNKDRLVTLYINIADSYRNTGQYLKAIKNGKEALNLIGEENFIESEASAKSSIGASFYHLKKYNEALLFLNAANDIATKDGFLHIKMITHDYLAKVYESLDDINNALLQQKKYNTTRETYLKTLTSAQQLKIEKESENKTMTINLQEQEIDFLNKEKIIYIIVAFIMLCFFILFILNYYKKKKVYKNNTQQLKGDNTFLENENELLRDKLNRFALVLKENNAKKQYKKNKKTSLTDEEQELYKEKILNYMETSRPYLNSQIKQLDVAKELNMNLHLLSETLNTSFKQNFNNFINLYRVNEAKQLMKKPEYRKYKIITIAYDSGFSSKPSFNRVFKNLVGCTPTEFQKKHNT